jgi:hypothetical protein
LVASQKKGNEERTQIKNLRLLFLFYDFTLTYPMPSEEAASVREKVRRNRKALNKINAKRLGREVRGSTVFPNMFKKPTAEQLQQWKTTVKPSLKRLEKKTIKSNLYRHPGRYIEGFERRHVAPPSAAHTKELLRASGYAAKPYLRRKMVEAFNKDTESETNIGRAISAYAAGKRARNIYDRRIITNKPISSAKRKRMEARKAAYLSYPGRPQFLEDSQKREMATARLTQLGRSLEFRKQAVLRNKKRKEAARSNVTHMSNIEIQH